MSYKEQNEADLVIHSNKDQIRDEKVLTNIRRYIKNNPSNWENDFYNSNNK